MHPLGGTVNRVERTLLNFFSRRCVRGGFFRALEGRFAGNFGAAVRRGWAVLPRNSAVFEWREGAARRFSARRIVPGARGEKFFKNFLERGEKPKNWGARGVGKWCRGALYRVRGAIFGSGNETSGSVARGALRAGVSATATRLRSQRFVPLIYRGHVASSIAHSWGHLCLSDPQFSNPHLWLENSRLPYPGYDHILSK